MRQCLDAERLVRMRAAIDKTFALTKANTRFGFLQLGPDFVNLIDHPKILPLLQEFIGPKLRLDHTYGMAMAADGRGEGEGLHHEGNGGSHGIGHGSYYHTHGHRMHSGLLVVAFSLTDNPAGMGFSVVPGSHKALFPTPRGLGGMDAANSYGNSIVVQPELMAGDALLFTEAPAQLNALFGLSLMSYSHGIQSFLCRGRPADTEQSHGQSLDGRGVRC